MPIDTGESARDVSTFARGCRASIRELRNKLRLEDTEDNRALHAQFKERSDVRILHALNACNDAKMVCKSFQVKTSKLMETQKNKPPLAAPGSISGGGSEGVCLKREREDDHAGGSSKIARNRLNEDEKMEREAKRQASWDDFMDFASKCLARRPGARVHTSLLMLAYQAHFVNSFRQGEEISLGMLGQYLHSWDAKIGASSHGGWYNDLALSYVISCGCVDCERLRKSKVTVLRDSSKPGGLHAGQGLAPQQPTSVASATATAVSELPSGVKWATPKGF